MSVVHYFVGTKVSDLEFLEYFFWTNDAFHQALLAYPESKLEGQEVVEFIDNYCVEKRRSLHMVSDVSEDMVHDTLDHHVQSCLRKVFSKTLDILPGLEIETLIEDNLAKYIIGLPLGKIHDQPIEEFLLYLIGMKREIAEKLQVIFPDQEREIRVYSHLNLLHPCNSQRK